MGAGFQGVGRLRDDDILATPGSPRERGRDAILQMQQHLDEIEERRQQVNPNDLSVDEVRQFRQQNQRI